ncbi:HERC2 [Symbiodinium natans]|uniref:HERC2 protein n=1 Tax=Symbiodinium natans TaxID=878477 RepID=A0A812MDJ8_9DINO|nr:HERC2 [Symbiodinium natans]
MTFALSPSLQAPVHRRPEEDAGAESAAEVLEESLTLPFRYGAPSLFPEALVGPWVRGYAVINVREGFICEELDDIFSLQVFPEIIYPPWGEWVLNVSRSTPQILEWVPKMDVDGICSRRVIRWIRPWLLEGRLLVDSAGHAAVNGSYVPDFSGSAVRYVKTPAEGPKAVELRHIDPHWAFVSVEDGKEQLLYTAVADALVGQWNTDSQLAKASGALPGPRISFWQQAPDEDLLAAQKSLALNVRPRCVCRLPSEAAASMVVSEGVAAHFAGDAVVFVDFETDGTPEEAFPALGAPLPATWRLHLPARAGAGGGLNQPGEEGGCDLPGALRQGLEALLVKGAGTVAISAKGGSPADKEALAAAAVTALLDVAGEGRERRTGRKVSGSNAANSAGRPLELHLVVEGPPPDILRSRDAVERAIAKRSDLASP